MKNKKIILILGIICMFKLTYAENADNNVGNNNESVQIIETLPEEKSANLEEKSATEEMKPESPESEVNKAKVLKNTAVTPKKNTSKSKKEKEKMSLSEQLDSNILKLEEMLNRF